MKDARTKTYAKSFCPKAVLPPIALGVAETEGFTALDFGCGKDAYWVAEGRERGIDIDGIDLSRPDLQPKEKYDLVFLSNVVNVQETDEQLKELIEKVFFFDPEIVLFNYPASPRKMGLNIQDICNLIVPLLPLDYELRRYDAPETTVPIFQIRIFN